MDVRTQLKIQISSIFIHIKQFDCRNNKRRKGRETEDDITLCIQAVTVAVEE